jgi:hypothetical protein
MQFDVRINAITHRGREHRGGGFWAAAMTVQGVNFFITDYAESPAPNPDYVLHVGGHSAQTGEYLDFSMEVEGLQDAMAKLPGWAESLQEALAVGAGRFRMVC